MGERDAVSTGAPSTESAGRAERALALDGLRALAFLLVFAYHAQIPGFGGGFLGVDVFFVLSGFLVTRILLQTPQVDGSSTLDFVARRLRRIMPMLVVVVVVTTLLLVANGSPGQLFRQRGEAIATLLSVANVWAAVEGQSYFAQFVARSPLTPTWTLSIEVQFYVAWSLVVLWAARGRRLARVAGAAAVLTVVSIVVMALGVVVSDPSSIYFNTVARLHQPLIGALLACAVVSGRYVRSWPPRRGVVSLAVLAACVLVLRNSGEAYYLGGSTVVAVAAAALVGSLTASGASPLGRGLSWAPAVGLGRISYSAYLWHWPVIITLSERRTGLSAPLLWVLWFAVTVVLSLASHRWVERRGMSLRLSPGRTFAAVAVAVVAAIVVVLVCTSGARRDPLDAAAAIAAPPVPPELADLPAVALVGDSVAQSLSPAFVADGRATGYAVADGAFPGCPVVDLEPFKADGAPAVANNERCAMQADTARREIGSRWQPDVVLWASALEVAHLRDPDGRLLAPGSAAWADRLTAALEAAYDRDVPDGSRLVVMVPAPPDDAGPEFSAETEAYLQVLEDFVGSRPGAVLVDLAELPCGRRAGCRDGAPDRPDGIHYTGESAGLVVARLRGEGLLPDDG